MIIDGTFPSEITEGASPSEKAVASFLKFIEKKLDIAFVRNSRGVPEEMLSPLRFGHLLQEKGIIKSFGRVEPMPDEPPMKMWFAVCNDPTSHQVGGSSW